METKPTTWQEQGPFSSVVEMQVEEGATVGHNVSLQHRKAPKAMPEEDLDGPESGTKVKASQASQPVGMTEMIDVIKIGYQKSSNISQCIVKETQKALTELEERPEKLSEAQEETKKADDLCVDDYPPPSLFNALSATEYGEKEGFSSLEWEHGEWMKEAEPLEDGQECLETPTLLQQSCQDINRTSELNLTTGGIHTKRTETTSQSAQHDLCNINSTECRYTLNSPPFADESGEEEGAEQVVTTCRRQINAHEPSSMGFQPSQSDPEETNSVLPASGSVSQEKAVLPQSRSEIPPWGLNQEAAQQVFSRVSLPGSVVAMEPANQGAEHSQGHSCVAAVRERSRRVWERTEGENEQTGGVKGQSKSEVEKTKAAVRSESEGLFRYLQAVQTQEHKAENSCGLPLKANRDTRMRTDMSDDSQSDSGVSFDFHSYRTLNSSMSTDSLDPVCTETPIEREIRRAIQREQSLRRSRGLPDPSTSPEYVEVPLRKSLLSQSVTPKWSQSKDREFAGKKMQHEIHEESRREQDLVKIGKIPGFYDKGTVRQIKERKQLFETLHISPESPLMISPKSKTPSWSSTSSEDLNLTLESQDSGTSTPEHTYVERNPMTANPSQSQTYAKVLDHSSLRGPRFSEGTGCQIILLENGPTIPAEKHYKVKAVAEPILALETENNFNSLAKEREHAGLMKTKKKQEEQKVAGSKENPFFKLRSSTNLDKVRQDIQEAKEREKELRTLRLSLYGGTSETEMAAPDPLSNGRSGSHEGQMSVTKVSPWPPAQKEEEKISFPEIRKSPRTPRQKNPLVQLWESGQVNGYNPKDD